MPSSPNEHNGFEFMRLPNGWTVGRFGCMDALGGIVHAVTTRDGLDVQLVVRDRDEAARQVAAAIGVREIAFLKQVHGNTVLAADRGGLAGDADGLVTDTPGLAVLGVSADCPLILAADAAGRAVGVAHASWRGTVAQVARRLVETMARRYGTRGADVVACICPSASPARYEVGPDVLAAARQGLGPSAEEFFQVRQGKTFFDMWAANRHQLLAAGARPENVHIAGLCTIEGADHFPSYRREGAAAGRFVAVIARRGK